MRADVIIVGAGPAGLSAALVLGRCCRRVLVFDEGRHRNAVSGAVHGFLTQEGTPPATLRRIAREQLAPYAVDYRCDRVLDITRTGELFAARLASGDEAFGRKVLLATGIVDCLPPIEGLLRYWGKQVFSCPYCDGWEVRGRTLAAYAAGPDAADLVLGLTTWSPNLILLTDGRPAPVGNEAAQLARHGVRVVTEAIAGLDGEEQLTAAVLRSGERVPLDAMFLHAGQVQRADLAARLGCEIHPRGTVATGKYERTRVPGVYVAGDAAGHVQFAIVAAAEGAEAAYAINRELRLEDTR